MLNVSNILTFNRFRKTLVECPNIILSLWLFFSVHFFFLAFILCVKYVRMKAVPVIVSSYSDVPNSPSVIEMEN